MMKTKNFLIPVTALIFVLSGCGPKVMTGFVKTYPETVSPASVYVFEQGDTVRYSADTLGRVSVVSDKFTGQCEYNQVLELAKKEVAKAGGNSYQVTDHIFPSSRENACHQVSGLALRIARDSIDFLNTNRMPGIPGEPQMNAGNKYMTSVGKTSMSAYWGGGWITSDVYAGNQVYKGTRGMDWRFEIQQMFGKGFGMAFQYSGSKTILAKVLNMQQIYIGPTLVYVADLNRWLFSIGAGAGYFGLKESSKNIKYSVLHSGYGFNAQITLEYLLSRYVGLSGGCYVLSGHFPGKQDEYLNPKDVENLNRVNILLGLHYYF